MKAKQPIKQLGILPLFALLLGLAACSAGPSGLQVFCTANCTPPPPAPEYLFATSADHILVFTVDPSSGSLTTATSASGPNQSMGMAASANGQLYVSDFLNDTVDGFTIGSTGALTAIGSPFSLSGTPPGAGGLSAFVEGDTYLYATDLNAGAVAGFSYNTASGALTAIPGSPFPAGDTPVQAVQTGFFVYVSNLNDSAGGISAYAINSQNGALSEIAGSPFPTGASGSFPGPSAMVVSVDGNFLFVALVGTANANNQIAAFAIDATTGALTAVPGSPFTTGNNPLQMAYVPITGGSDSFLYTANVADNTISAFTVDHNSGILTAVSGSPFAAGSSVGGLAVGPTGSYFLYQADPTAQAVRAYTIDPNTGALSPLTGSPFAAGSAPDLLAVASP